MQLQQHMSLKVVTPPSIEPFTVDEARIFLRIDVPGFNNGDNFQDTLIRSWIRAARQFVEGATDQLIGAQTIQVSMRHFTPMPWGNETLMGTMGDLSANVTFHSASFREIELPLGPVRSIDWIKYIDSATGDDLTVDPTTYKLTLDGRIALNYGASWPGARIDADSVRIQYQAGYAVDGDRDTSGERIGDDVIAAMRLLVGHFYTNRSAVIAETRVTPQLLPLGVDVLLQDSRRSFGI